MWNITGLSQGDHQVVISNVGTEDPNTSIRGLDYLEYVGYSVRTLFEGLFVLFRVTPGADGKINPTSAGPYICSHSL